MDHELSRHPASHPLSDPRDAAGVLDLLVGIEAREQGCLMFGLVDGSDVMVLPVLVDDVVPGADPRKVVDFLGMLFEHLDEPGGGLLFARGRPGGRTITDEDRVWHQCVIDACRTAGVRLLGAYVASSAGMRLLPPALAAAG